MRHIGLTSITSQVQSFNQNKWCKAVTQNRECYNIMLYNYCLYKQYLAGITVKCQDSVEEYKQLVVMENPYNCKSSKFRNYILSSKTMLSAFINIR